MSENIYMENAKESERDLKRKNEDKILTVGFTGTSRGINSVQYYELRRLVINFKPKAVRHGDCIGADYSFNAICDYGKRTDIIYVHPPIDPKKRAFVGLDLSFAGTKNETTTFILNPKHYLERNKDIVDGSDIMIATPGEEREVLRSGTWSTIRYAKKQKNKMLFIIYPSGAIEIYGCR